MIKNTYASSSRCVQEYLHFKNTKSKQYKIRRESRISNDAQNAYFEGRFYFSRSQRGNLHRSLLTTSSLTCFISQVHTEKCVHPTLVKKMWEEVLEETKLNERKDRNW